jgi:hypothetical protein
MMQGVISIRLFSRLDNANIISMKLIQKFGLVIISCFFVGAIWAQQAETTIITESSEPLEDIYIDDIIPKRMIFENRVLPYEPVREADIPWEKRIWRIIDTREKINLPFAYPEKPFFTILAEATESGSIKVFSDDKFKEMLTPDEVSAQLVYMDTSIVCDESTDSRYCSY